MAFIDCEIILSQSSRLVEIIVAHVVAQERINFLRYRSATTSTTFVFLGWHYEHVGCSSPSVGMAVEMRLVCQGSSG